MCENAFEKFGYGYMFLADLFASLLEWNIKSHWFCYRCQTYHESIYKYKHWEQLHIAKTMHTNSLCISISLCVLKELAVDCQNGYDENILTNNNNNNHNEKYKTNTMKTVSSDAWYNHDFVYHAYNEKMRICVSQFLLKYTCLVILCYYQWSVVFHCLIVLVFLNVLSVLHCIRTQCTALIDCYVVHVW